MTVHQISEAATRRREQNRQRGGQFGAYSRTADNAIDLDGDQPANLTPRFPTGSALTPAGVVGADADGWLSPRLSTAVDPAELNEIVLERIADEIVRQRDIDGTDTIEPARLRARLHMELPATLGFRRMSEGWDDSDSPEEFVAWSEATCAIVNDPHLDTASKARRLEIAAADLAGYEQSIQPPYRADLYTPPAPSKEVPTGTGHGKGREGSQASQAWRPTSAVAKDIRGELKQAVAAGWLPDGPNYSITTQGTSINVTVSNFSDDFLYPDSHDKYDPRQRLTRDAFELERRVKQIAESYTTDRSDSSSDYFDVDHYTAVRLHGSTGWAASQTAEDTQKRRAAAAAAQARVAARLRG